ncbi:site-specific integrase [Bacteroides faecis]|jgi:tyrosine site-specific recombinase|uniref:Site-specific integrase n=1 Tax=Bacteroides faecis TaxID=674529 RepID=A0ABY5T3T1_9BACE|nr:site-specific integrase [Bacteroides faecis]MCS2477934.1 site-specific integrase [Bacteroides faecis]MCS2548722.1 site-specific integrase [Bacteroides faecis]MCS2914268.1 site-specific integrase [Bacteroides faecis]MCS2975607.1 site-specific integrase [Bacteroides faecis]UBE43034.1 site-specific integrase [Bacteroides faecis]
MKQKKFKEKKPGKNFFQLAEERILHFKKLGKKKTASNYTCALRHFKQFREEEDIAVEDLSVGLMKDFQAHLINVGLGMNTISLYNRQLRAIYNYALDEEIVLIDRRPFRKSFTGQEKTRKRAVSHEKIRKLTHFSLVGKNKLEFARDLFLFSIYMQGMPFVDIAYLKKEQVKNDFISYKRKKTNRHLTVKLHEKAKAIIHKYKVNDPDCPYLFPILYNPQRKVSVEYSSALRTHNNRLRQISELMGFDELLTSYVARHTWASQARQCGVHDTVISEAMGHNNLETTTIYLTSLDTGLIASANFQVIASFARKQT